MWLLSAYRRGIGLLLVGLGATVLFACGEGATDLGAVDVYSSLLMTDTTGPLRAGGLDRAQITVVLRSRSYVPAAGVRVRLEATAPGQIAPSVCTTNPQGAAQAKLVAHAPGLVTVRAEALVSDVPLVLAGTPQVHFVEPGVCGNGLSEEDEACDDGNTLAGDDCSPDCQNVTDGCGDSEVDDDEVCDDGYQDACGSCNEECSGPGNGSTCGDGKLCPETETCDGDCVTSCSDADVCTVDLLTGSAATCDLRCTFHAIAACVHGDGCCPDDCHANNDSDCDPLCGNGVLEPSGGETCDGNCPTACDDAQACTTDLLVGDPSTCDAFCTHQVITACQDADGCCPKDCAVTSDSDCADSCGDGFVGGEELCDDGDPQAVDACSSDCGQLQLTGLDCAEGDRFGFAVALGNNTVVVGAPGDDEKSEESGAAYVFYRDGTGNFSQARKLTASNATGGELFGTRVAAHADNVVVGAYGAKAPGGGTSCGTAHLYARHQGGPDNWGEVKTLVSSDGAAMDDFGASVSISGEIIAVGADGDNCVGGGTWCGAAYVFERDHGGPGNWGEVVKLSSFDASEGDHFGATIAVSGETLAVGAEGDDCTGGGEACGAVYLFHRDRSGQWALLEKVRAPDATASDHFGSSISLEGETLVVGAFGDDCLAGGVDCGSTYVFHCDGADRWLYVQKIMPPQLAEFDSFGYPVALGGTVLAIGACKTECPSGHLDCGAIYLMQEQGASHWGLLRTVTPVNAAPTAAFGFAAAANTANLVVVGAPWQPSPQGGDQICGAAYLLRAWP